MNLRMIVAVAELNFNLGNFPGQTNLGFDLDDFRLWSLDDKQAHRGQVYTKLTAAQKKASFYPSNIDSLSPAEADGFLVKVRLCLGFISVMTNGSADGSALVAGLSALLRDGESLHMLLDTLGTMLKERVVALKLMVAAVTQAAKTEMLNAAQTWAVATANGFAVPFAILPTSAEFKEKFAKQRTVVKLMAERQAISSLSKELQGVKAPKRKGLVKVSGRFSDEPPLLSILPLQQLLGGGDGRTGLLARIFTGVNTEVQNVDVQRACSMVAQAAPLTPAGRACWKCLCNRRCNLSKCKAFAKGFYHFKQDDPDVMLNRLAMIDRRMIACSLLFGGFDERIIAGLPDPSLLVGYRPADDTTEDGIAAALETYAKAQNLCLKMWFRSSKSHGSTLKNHGSVATSAASGTRLDDYDGVPVNVLGFLDQVRIGLEVSERSEQLQALLKRASDGCAPRECFWWEEGESGVPKGNVSGERSTMLLNLACIDCRLDEHLEGYSEVGRAVPDFKAWVLEHVRQGVDPVLEGADTPKVMDERLASSAGRSAIEGGLRAAEEALAAAGDPLSNVGRGGLRVGWGNIQSQGEPWLIHSKREAGWVSFTGRVPGGSSLVLKALDLGGGRQSGRPVVQSTITIAACSKLWAISCARTDLLENLTLT